MQRRPTKVPTRRRSNLYRNRRKVLKRLGTDQSSERQSDGFSGNWRTPVVDSAVLPTHAEKADEAAGDQ